MTTRQLTGYDPQGYKYFLPCVASIQTEYSCIYPYLSAPVVTISSIFLDLAAMELSFKKSRRSRSETVSYLDDCNIESIKQACLIGNEENYLNSSKPNENCGIHGVVITSTPNPKTSRVRTILNSEEQDSSLNQRNFSNEDSNAVSVSKLLSVVERKRRDVSYSIHYHFNLIPVDNNHYNFLLLKDAISKRNAALRAIEEQNRQEEAELRAQLEARSDAAGLKKHEDLLRLQQEEETQNIQWKQRQELKQQKQAQVHLCLIFL